MGHLTPILIRNDDLGSIEKDPEIIQKISIACMNRKPISIPTNYWKLRKWYQFRRPKKTKTVSGCCNAIESMECRHADEPRLFVVSGNTMIELTDIDMEKSKTYKDFVVRCAKFAKRQASEVLTLFKDID